MNFRDMWLRSEKIYRLRRFIRYHIPRSIEVMRYTKWGNEHIRLDSKGIRKWTEQGRYE